MLLQKARNSPTTGHVARLHTLKLYKTESEVWVWLRFFIFYFLNLTSSSSCDLFCMCCIELPCIFFFRKFLHLFFNFYDDFVKKMTSYKSKWSLQCISKTHQYAGHGITLAVVSIWWWRQSVLSKRSVTFSTTTLYWKKKKKGDKI